MRPAIAKFNRTLHWTSSALGLATLLFFSVTGITLNHPDWFSAERQLQEDSIMLDAAWLQDFRAGSERDQLLALTAFTEKKWQLAVPSNIDRDAVEWVLDYQRPGGIATVVLDLEAGELLFEAESDGLVALINDLHKGRHSGLAWKWLIDIVAIICCVFAITGLVLLYLHARKRRSTWPLVLLGTLLPVYIYWSFVP